MESTKWQTMACAAVDEGEAWADSQEMPSKDCFS